jgi:hypothetical protein
LDVAVTTTTIINPTNALPDEARQADFASRAAAPDAGKLIFNLGLWLSGLESFLNIQNHSFTAEDSRARSAARDWSKEFRLTHSTLLLCSSLTFQLQHAFNNQNLSAEDREEFGFSDETGAAIESLDISAAEIFELSMTLRDAVLLGEGLLRAAPLKFVEWTAWSNSLGGKLKKARAFDKLIKAAEKTGEEFLPPKITALLARKTLSAAEEADLKLVLPRIAKILKWLAVIEEIIFEDKPLKPALLIFARVYEYIRELTNYINNRLLRFPDQEDDLYGALDGAAYVASIELRKVYQHELTNVTEIRPTPQARARIEASQGLLNDSFQQTLVGFARLLDPSVNDFDVFPVFREKLNASIILRRDLWELLQDVKKAEQTVETHPLEELNAKLNKFVQTSMRHLMYKDWETFERFVEEITRTSNRNDLTPILHRFGAYLETLFGQVKMRSVLANHPFEFPQR